MLEHNYGTAANHGRRNSQIAGARNDTTSYKKNGVGALYFYSTPTATYSTGAPSEDLFGFRRDEVVGEHFSRLFFRPEEARRGEPEFELRTAEVKGRSFGHRWYTRRDGTAAWCCGVTVALHERIGGRRVFVKALRDLTRKKLLKQKSVVADDYSHDFDDLLTLISDRDQLSSGSYSSRVQGCDLL